MRSDLSGSNHACAFILQEEETNRVQEAPAEIIESRRNSDVLHHSVLCIVHGHKYSQ